MPEVFWRTLAPAKINLFLHVGPARRDGRHELDSLVVFAGPEAADRLEVRLGEDADLEVSGPFAGGVGLLDHNLVLGAYKRLRSQVRIDPQRDSALHFHLEKHLPVAAGLGGGSADAAAALRLMTEEIYDLPARVATDLAPQLGGDVLACVWNVPVMMRGDGDRVSPIANPGLGKLFARPEGGLPAVLVNPGFSCPTGAVFERFDMLGGGSDFRQLTLPDLYTADELIVWLARRTHNDLEAAAIERVPEIGALLDRLTALPNVQLARMSGSGATCFALFDTMDQATEAEAVLAAERPDWWVRSTRLGDGA